MHSIPGSARRSAGLSPADGDGILGLDFFRAEVAELADAHV